ncbi:MAG: cytochrome c [Verrucomicrobia bacterium]|jgi:cytochrome c2|nr:cytochrome c [Verrucomicrobiota bacterium]
MNTVTPIQNHMRGIFKIICIWISFWIPSQLNGQDAAADYLEPSSDWMASTIDARKIEGFEIKDNLAIRGLVFRLGNGAYGCFDTDLLRWSVVWHGDFLSYRSMSTQSYFQVGKKNSGGQVALCAPTGNILTATGLYPGGFDEIIWLADPREKGPDKRDLGRGPIASDSGKWISVNQTLTGPELEYKIGDTLIHERSQMLQQQSNIDWIRLLEIEPHDKDLVIVLGSFPNHQIQLGSNRGAAGKAILTETDEAPTHFWARSDASKVHLEYMTPGNVVLARFAPSAHTTRARIFVGQSPNATIPNSLSWIEYPKQAPAKRQWPETITTQWAPHSEQGAYIQEKLPLPEDNPWNRKVRSSAMAFDEDGTLWVTTFDGDVWKGKPDDSDDSKVHWNRIATGLHEPMSLCLRDGRLFTFTRNGIIELKDNDGNGEYEEHFNFCNQFTQTAESREFAMDMVMANDGSFYISKGGQQLTYEGIDNGKVLHVSRDGESVEEVASGLRQPFLGYSKKWDMVTASDQQGHWTPSTPVHWIRDGKHYGFRPSTEVNPPTKPTTEPLCWIPHRIVQSGGGQIWLGDEGMGNLNNTMVYLDYYRPRLVSVYTDQLPSPRQAAVVPLPFKFDIPILKAVQHPTNHYLHLVGFKIWGSNSSEWAGIVRLRPTGKPANYPVEVKGLKDGLFLKFDQPLNPDSARNPAHYSVQRWNYKRSANYGSGYYKLNGETGTEWMGLYGAYLTDDHKGVFIAVADPQPVMQVEVVYRIQSQSQEPLEGSAYFTFHHLPETDWQALGFSKPPLNTNASVVTGAVESLGNQEISVSQGKALYESMGCMACHSIDGSTEGRVGPTFADLIGKTRSFVKGKNQVADASYIRESILNPAKKVIKAYAESDIGMPTYEGVLTDNQISSLIEYIKTLK